MRFRWEAGWWGVLGLVLAAGSGRRAVEVAMGPRVEEDQWEGVVVRKNLSPQVFKAFLLLKGEGAREPACVAGILRKGLDGQLVAERGGEVVGGGGV